MTIRMKIVGGLSLVALIGLVFAIVGLISTRMLTEQSNELYLMKNTESSITTVLNAHFEWRQALTESVLTGNNFNGALDPSACAYGTWKNSAEANAITDTETLSMIAQMEDAHAAMHTDASRIVSMLQSGDLEGAKKELMEGILPNSTKVVSLLVSAESRYGQLIGNKNAELISLGSLMSQIIIGLIILVTIVTLIMNWRITESILKPIRNITTAAETIASGNLDVNVDYHTNDQIGSLVRSFRSLVEVTKKQAQAADALANGDLTVKFEPRSDKDVMSFALMKMVDSLNHMFGEIRRSTAQVAAGSKQIETGSQSLAHGSAEQTSAIEELSASFSEIVNQTKKNAGIAKEASDLTGTIRDSAEKGNTQMDQMMQAVREINDAGSQIEKVIKVIDDIAFQTNILALNAAVEAARAGQHGKGFAVVAEEVRNLASKSAEAAKDTGGLIENSIQKANLGLSIAIETAASLREIVEGINRSAEIVALIASSSDEQAGSIAQVNAGITQIAQVIQTNSATAEESAAASAEMSGQSDLLDNLIARFKLNESAYQRSQVAYSKPLEIQRNTQYDFSTDYGKY